MLFIFSFIAHINCSSRFLSSFPLFYYALAEFFQHSSFGKHSVILFLVYYNVAGIVFFPNFLLWAWNIIKLIMFKFQSIKFSSSAHSLNLKYSVFMFCLLTCSDPQPSSRFQWHWFSLPPLSRCCCSVSMKDLASRWPAVFSAPAWWRRDEQMRLRKSFSSSGLLSKPGWGNHCNFLRISWELQWSV